MIVVRIVHRNALDIGGRHQIGSLDGTHEQFLGRVIEPPQSSGEDRTR